MCVKNQIKSKEKVLRIYHTKTQTGGKYKIDSRTYIIQDIRGSRACNKPFNLIFLAWF